MSALPCRLLLSVLEAVLVSNLEINGASDDGRGLDLLPNCLSMISSSTAPVLVSGEQGDNLQISGKEYKEHIVSRFLAIPWSKRLLTRMACILRELLLDSEEIEDFLKKIFSHMKEVEPQDLPFLVYQLVVLASRDHKRAIINGIMSFFSKLQTSQLQEPAQNGSNSARIQRFELQCFDVLKAAAVKLFQDCERCRDSLWASSALGATCLKTAKDTELSFMRTVQSSAFGWDHIIPSVVQLGFIFIESGAGGRFLSAQDVGHSERATAHRYSGLGLEDVGSSF